MNKKTTKAFIVYQASAIADMGLPNILLGVSYIVEYVFASVAKAAGTRSSGTGSGGTMFGFMLGGGSAASMLVFYIFYRGFKKFTSGVGLIVVGALFLCGTAGTLLVVYAPPITGIIVQNVTNVTMSNSTLFSASVVIMP